MQIPCGNDKQRGKGKGQSDSRFPAGMTTKGSGLLRGDGFLPGVQKAVSLCEVDLGGEELGEA